MTAKQLQIRGRNVNFVETGQGTPLLLVHGFPLNLQMWQYVVEPLASQFRVIAPDLPGFGKSDSMIESTTPQPLTMEMLADWLADFLDAIDVSEATFCGLSMGGYIGWSFAQRYPDRLNRLVACNTRAAADSEVIRRGRKVAAENVIRHGTESLKTDLVPKLFGNVDTPDAEKVSLIQSMVGSADPMTVACAQLGMSQRQDMTTWLSSNQTPTLFLAGDSDPITSADEMKSNADLVKNSRWICVNHAGHLVPVQQPNVFVQAVTEFLADEI